MNQTVCDFCGTVIKHGLSFDFEWPGTGKGLLDHSTEIWHVSLNPQVSHKRYSEERRDICKLCLRNAIDLSGFDNA